MSMSSDLKLISDMTSRLSFDVAKAPRGAVSVDAWFAFHKVHALSVKLKSRLDALELLLPEEIEGNGTVLDEMDLSHASDACPPSLVDAYRACMPEDSPPMTRSHIASMLWGKLS